MTRRVSVVRCPEYDRERVESALERCLAPLGGMEAFVRRGERVLVKPNLLASRPPEAAVTTHPTVIRATVRAIQAIGGEVVVGDSPGGRNTPTGYSALLRRTGLTPVLDECGCEAVFFDSATTELSCSDGRVFRRFRVADAVADADRIVSLSKFKTHQFTLFTGAVKNCFGYIPGVTKAEYHLNTGQDPRRFASMLLDLHQARPPDLSIMDAVLGMEGDGPSNGTPREVGLLIASPWAPDLDYIASSLMGYDPLDVPTVAEAVARGQGPSSLDDVELYGELLDGLRVPDMKKPGTHLVSRIPAPLLAVASRLFAARPGVRKDRCRGCGVCVENCPAEAMDLVGNRPRIRHGACIRCYCCQELCPADAIAVDRPFLRRLIG
jgi:uncharacterized protein (DUF362 family)/Pyruvate/2-oxoacid:ferredoxin oxidoreductase delta subunit